MSLNMEVSDRDKQLIYLIAAIAIIAAAYFFGWRNFSEQKSSYQEQTKQYDEEYTTLIEHQKKRDEYKKKTEEYINRKAEILTKYEKDFSQEYLITTLDNIEKATEAWFEHYSLATPAVVYTFKTEQNTSGVMNAISISFEGDYAEFKNLLASVLNIKSQTSLDSVNVQYDEANQVCKGDIALSHYYLLTPESTVPDVKVDMPVGVGNIFDSDIVMSATQTQAVNGSYILTDYDFCIAINPNESTMDAVIVGTSIDAKAKDSVSTDENKSSEVTITFDGKEGKYTVSYEVDGKQYPAKNYEKGVAFKPGETLDLLVKSSPRENNKDKVAVKANIINNTDMELNVLVSEDDTNSPRFTAGKREGKVTIYR
ncbi:MAG: hypothetical protein ACI4AQ_10155 [Lachnospiraceae bacterium]